MILGPMTPWEQERDLALINQQHALMQRAALLSHTSAQSPYPPSIFGNTPTPSQQVKKENYEANQKLLLLEELNAIEAV